MSSNYLSAAYYYNIEIPSCTWQHEWHILEDIFKPPGHLKLQLHILAKKSHYLCIGLHEMQCKTVIQDDDMIAIKRILQEDMNYR